MENGDPDWGSESRILWEVLLLLAPIRENARMGNANSDSLAVSSRPSLLVLPSFARRGKSGSTEQSFA